MACKWQLRFNADKCVSMRITHSREKSETNYFLEKPLKDVDNFKDLGVTITTHGVITLFLSTDKNFHVYKHLNGSPSCKRKCSVDCFKTVDSAKTRHCLKLEEAIYIRRLP